MINGFDYDPMTYIDDMEMTNYIVDCNREYSEVLAEKETVHVYGDTLLQSDGDTIISGSNNSVIAEIGVDEVKNIRYDDYGYSDEMLSGHGYKGEMQDESGLIYLRVRYYDPDLMRFIQLDTNYEGEEEDVTSQNRYAYTLNNPYKYVDRDGNKASSLLGVIRATVNAAKKLIASKTKTVKQALTTKQAEPVKMTSVVKSVTKTVKNIANGSGKNGQRSKQSVISKIMNTPTVKCVIKEIKSPYETPEGRRLIMIKKISDLGLKKVFCIEVVTTIAMFVYCGCDISALNSTYFFDLIYMTIFAFWLIFAVKLNIFTGANKIFRPAIFYRYSLFVIIALPVFLVGIIFFIKLLITRRFEGNALIVYVAILCLYTGCRTVEIKKEYENKGPWS